MEGKKSEPEIKKGSAASAGGGEDQELEALLNASLEQFGKHLPTSKQQASAVITAHDFDSGMLGVRATVGPRLHGEQPHLEQAFGDAVAAQAEAQLNETIQTLKKENPDLMKQFESFAQSFGLEDMPLEMPELESNSPVDPPSSSSAHEGGATATSKSSLDAALEDTVRNLQQSAEHLQNDGLPPQFMEMLSKLQVQGDKADSGEEGLLKMMEGMMGTLLSREVLYPSLQDLVSQYPDWLRRHEDSLDPEDKQRYYKQLELMQKICIEFESEEAEGGKKKASSGHQKQRQQRILSLMQELQDFGQPPEDLAGASLGPPGFPAPPNSDKCPIM